MEGLTVSGSPLLIALIAIYFVPGWIAAWRDHPDTPTILVLDLLLGWSVIGWVAALVWALRSIDQ